MDYLTISTCQASNMDFFTRDLAGYISKRLTIPVKVELDIPWQERERRLDIGEIDVCWICGLPYIRKVAKSSPVIELLAAPVMQGERYQDRPIYFSDVVVRDASHFQTLEDLRGTTWAYNEPDSHSGYNIVRYALAMRDENSGFFGRVIESGAHQVSLQLILRGEVDASAIDSTVLEQELRDDPSIRGQIRIIDIFGPSPIPPWVISKTTRPDWQSALRRLFLGMHRNLAGKTILDRANMIRFAAIEDADYNPIRTMTRKGRGICLKINPLEILDPCTNEESPDI
ncbi:MAG: PhnD/SsuA/transferrin family substrate-binding protein [Anaerolineaceae bacterium]|jgi:phosphonate transport system substrate-binding protein